MLEPKIGQVKADPGQLSQVIMNLAVNARDAMPQGGKLTIETDNVYLDESYADRHVRTQARHIRDAGGQRHRHRASTRRRRSIFSSRFSRPRKSAKEPGSGSSTVYGIVKQSGGYIWVDSELGEGTTFQDLSAAVERKRAGRERKRRVVGRFPTGTETILLVEDEEIVRRSGRQILESCGYQVIEARNGDRGA